MRQILVAWISMLIVFPAFCQTGGATVYNFLDMPVSARQAALGGKLISLRSNDDPSMAIFNPSMLNASMNYGVGFNCVDYFSDAVYGHLNYIQDFKKAGTFNFAFQFTSYGKFEGYDELGESTGTFSAGDYALYVGYGRELVDSTFSLGMNLKAVFSDYEQYFSAGIAVDFAASYYHYNKNISLSLLLKNVGAQFNRYEATREKLPIDLQLAFSQRLRHLPVRYNIILHHLYKWNMYYNDPADPFASIDGSTGEKIEDGKGKRFANNLFRHFIIALEVMPVKYVSLQAAFDYNERCEMRAYSHKGGIGFSYGIGVHFYHINIYYGRSHNNLVSVPNYFTISTNISSFFK